MQRLETRFGWIAPVIVIPGELEMEALAAAAIALLTIYDMAKAIDRGMTITGIVLLQKTGGASGEWTRSAADGD